MRDKQFIMNSIKMDLHRVVTAAGDVSKELPKESVSEFMTHAVNDFDKAKLTIREKKLRDQLKILLKLLPALKDPHKRLRWTEDVLTVRCRL
jgi:hypothetical protein